MFDSLKRLWNLSKVIDDKTIKEIEVHKGWSEDWLKSNEANYLAGGTSINNPYQQSYLVYKCINTISQNAAQVPVQLLNLQDEPIPLSDPYYKIFKTPNSQQSWFDFMQSLISFYNLYGEGFIYLEPSIGQVTGLTKMPANMYALNPKYVKHVLDQEGNISEWVWKDKQPLGLENVLHIAMFVPTGYRGMSPIDPIKLEIEGDLLAAKYNRNFFQNNSTPEGLIIIDKEKQIGEPELKKLAKQWDAGHKGVEKAHRVGFLKGGMSYQEVGLTQREMEFLKGRNFTRDQVLSIFGVPKTLAGYTEDLNYATAKVQKQIFWTETIRPQLIKVQDKYNSSYFNSRNIPIKLDFNFDSIKELQEEFESQVTTANTLFSIGFTRNEINDRLNLDMPTDTETGNTRYIASNLTPVINDPSQEEVPPSAEDDDTDDKSINSKKEEIFFKKLKKFLYDQRTLVLKKIDLIKEKKIIDVENIISELNLVEEEKKRMIKQFVLIYKEVLPYWTDDIILRKLKTLITLNDIVFKKIREEVLSLSINNLEINIDDLDSRIKTIYNFASSKAKIISKEEMKGL